MVLLLLVILWRRSKRGKAEPYELQETLFSPAERAFLGVLDLAVGDAAWALAQWRGRADAWFLDGFAPSTNPGMWSDAVMDGLQARSAPGARLATPAQPRL